MIGSSQLCQSRMYRQGWRKVEVNISYCSELGIILGVLEVGLVYSSQ